MSWRQLHKILLGRAPSVLVTMVLYSAIAVSTAMSGTFAVLDETRGRMTLHATLELRKLAPSHSPVNSVRELEQDGTEITQGRNAQDEWNSDNKI